MIWTTHPIVILIEQQGYFDMGSWIEMDNDTEIMTCYLPQSGVMVSKLHNKNE